MQNEEYADIVDAASLGNQKWPMTLPINVLVLGWYAIESVQYERIAKCQ